MKKFFSEMFQDVDGAYSSKRFMTFMGFLVWIQVIEMNMFQKISIDPDLKSLLFTLVLSGMGMITVEKLTNRGKDDTTTPK